MQKAKLSGKTTEVSDRICRRILTTEMSDRESRRILSGNYNNMIVMKTMPMPIMMTTSIPMTPLTMTITCMIYGADLSTRFVLSVIIGELDPSNPKLSFKIKAYCKIVGRGAGDSSSGCSAFKLAPIFVSILALLA